MDRPYRAYFRRRKLIYGKKSKTGANKGSRFFMLFLYHINYIKIYSFKVKSLSLSSPVSSYLL